MSWTVMSGGGSISPSTGTTGADGHTVAVWTLGTAGANTVQAVAAGLENSPVSFSAMATAPGSQLTIVSGNNQTGAPGQLVPLPLAVSLKTSSGAPLAGVAVTWAVSTGGGSLSQNTTPTDGQGHGSITWTLGSATGQQSVTASVAGAVGSPLTFVATAATPSGVVTLTSVSPSPLVEGQSATLTGTGFSVTPSSNSVTVDGVPATVTGATSTSLTITVPSFDCRPARTVAVGATVAAQVSNVLTQALNPAAFTSVPVGQLLVLGDPAKFCVQLPPSASAEDYLIGVQSTSELVTSVTPATLTSAVAPSAQTIAPLAALTGRAAGVVPDQLQRRSFLLAGHRRAEQRLREAEARSLDKARTMFSRGPNQGRASTVFIPPNLQVGDLLTVRVADLGSENLCTEFVEVSTVVKAVGTRGVWLADVTNPAGGYSDADYQTMSDQLDNTIYPVDVVYFGEPTDIDENGRLAVVVTDELNKGASDEGSGTIGFVFAGDLFLRSECGSSNEGEVFYGIAPDPAGEHAFGPLSRDQAMALQPLLIAHEFTHTIQVGRRLQAGAPPPARWFAEGQATLAEELVGHVVEGRAAGNNYGADIAWNDDNTATDWYSEFFADLVFYFGFENRDSKVAGAPEQCSWLDRPPTNSGPCGNSGRHVYLSWSLLRWLADQYGPGFAGGPQGLQRALINNPAVGYENITAVTGVPMKTILAQWAATLYADDRVTGLDPRVTLPSWNLFNIFDERVVETARLVPRSRGFANFTDNFSVRAGSSAYFRVSGSSRPATALRMRNSSGGSLPTVMQVFLVRLR